VFSRGIRLRKTRPCPSFLDRFERSPKDEGIKRHETGQ
jgi:hypothetical protein